MPLNGILQKGKDHLATPIVYLSRSNQHVVLVGVAHIALASFFAEVQRILDSLQSLGYLIAHEGFRWREAFTAEQLREIEPLLDQQASAWRSIGFATQDGAILSRAGWIETDSTHVDVIRNGVNETAMPDLYEENKRLAQQLVENPRSVAEILINGLRKRAEMDCTVPSSGVSRLANLQKRDSEAAAALIGFANDRDVAACWGAFHLPGIITLLEKDGFAIDRIEWLRLVPLSVT